MASTSFSIGLVVGGTVSATLGQAFSRVKQSQAGLARDLKDTSAQQKAVTSFNHYKTTLDQLKAKQTALSSQSPKLNQGIAEVEKRFALAKSKVEKYGFALSKTVQIEKDLTHQLGKTQSALAAKNAMAANKSARQSMHSEVIGAVGLALAVAAPLRTAINFEQSIAKLGAITQATEQDMSELNKTAQELGAKTQFSASQSAEAMTFLGMAGFKTNQIIQATPGMLNLAAAAGADLGQTADIASNILSGFNLQADQMGRVGDVLAKTFTSSNTNLSMLGETMKYVAPAASSVGASIEDVAAMTGMLGNVGIQGSNAGTALRSAFLRMVKPPAEARKAFESLGIGISDASGKMKAMPEILADIASATTHMTDVDRMALVTQMFGTEAASAMAELIKQAGNGALQNYSDQIRKSHGLTESMAKQMSDTTQGSLNRLGSALESVAIAIGSTVLPALASIVEGLAAVAGFVATAATKVPWLTQAVVGLGVGFVATKVSMLAFRYASTLVSDAVNSVRLVLPILASSVGFTTAKINLATAATTRLGFALRSTFIAAQTSLLQKGIWASATNAVTAFASTAVMAIRAVGLAIATNPIGLIVTGLVLAGFAIYKYWQPLSAFFKGVFQGISNALAPTIAELKDFANLFDPIFSPIGAVFSWVAEAIGSLFKPVETTTAQLDNMTAAGQRVGDVIGRAIHAIIHPLETAWNLMQGMAEFFKLDAGLKLVTSFFKSEDEEVPQAQRTAAQTVQPSTTIVAPVSAQRTAAQTVQTVQTVQPSTTLVAPASAQRAPQTSVIHNTPQFNITQLPGEDAEDLARRILRIQQEGAMRMELDYGR